jgi:hypothetical protein
MMANLENLIYFVSGMVFILIWQCIAISFLKSFSFKKRIKNSYKEHGLISAVKLYRELYSCGLKEAIVGTKEMCNHVEDWRRY